jgi:hypothetical protein
MFVAFTPVNNFIPTAYLINILQKLLIPVLKVYTNIWLNPTDTTRVPLLHHKEKKAVLVE